MLTRFMTAAYSWTKLLSFTISELKTEMDSGLLANVSSPLFMMSWWRVPASIEEMLRMSVRAFDHDIGT